MELKAENVKNIRSLALCKELLLQAIELNDQLNEELREKHRNVLAGNSRKAFAEAVKLDKELKEYGNED